MNPRQLALESYKRAIENQTLRDKPEHWHLWKRAYDEAFRDFKDQLPTEQEIQQRLWHYDEHDANDQMESIGFEKGVKWTIGKITENENT